MRDYTLNDTGFTPGPIPELKIGEGIDNSTNEELQLAYDNNRKMFEELEREYEERQRTGRVIA